MRKIITLSLLCTLFFSACTSYQLFYTTSDTVSRQSDDVYLFENEDLYITYDFWTEGGAVLFNVFNKREETLYLDMKESTFKVNNLSIGYYNKNVDEETSQQLDRDMDRVLIGEAPVQTSIAPGTLKTIEGLPITYNLSILPQSKSDIRFSKGTSPFVFSNMIAYSYDKELENKQYINNGFWVSRVERLNPSDFTKLTKNTTPKANKFFLRQESDGEDAAMVFELLGATAELILLISN